MKTNDLMGIFVSSKRKENEENLFLFIRPVQSARTPMERAIWLQCPEPGKTGQGGYVSVYEERSYQVSARLSRMFVMTSYRSNYFSTGESCCGREHHAGT